MILERLIRDARALGWGVPVRALYEGSKRVGVHRRLFRQRRSGKPPSLTIPDWTPEHVPPGVEERALAAADTVLVGSVELFGRHVELGGVPDWHSVVHRKGHWPKRPWWEIDVRSEARLGDVKWTWELGRHRHLVLLARAVFLRPNEPRYLRELEAQLRSWLNQNPIERGVHWYSNLELSLRSIAWLQILSLVSGRISDALVGRMTEMLYHTGRHLTLDLPYTVSAMRNNHLIGDGLGLVALGKAFPHDPAARRWERWGDRLVESQLRRQFRSDGSSIEDSVSYDRFVLEMLAVRMLLGGAPAIVRDSMEASVGYMCRLGVLEAAVPQFGDWDEGRALAVAGHAAELEGSVRLALSLLGTGAPEEWRSDHDEVAWYVGPGDPLAPEAAEAGGRNLGGEIARTTRGDLQVWLKAGHGPSHGHADLLSTPIRLDGHWVMGDPGTGTYNGPLEQRNYFRSSIAHSVARVEGRDQLEPYRVFRWRYGASGRIGDPIEVGATIVMWGTHDAYRRLDPSTWVVRAVIIAAGAVVVGDWIEDQRKVLLSLPLAPQVSWEQGSLYLGRSPMADLWTSGSITSVRGSEEPWDGWWSETYGQMEPSTRLEVVGRGPLVACAVGEFGGRPTVEGGRLRFGDLEVVVNLSGESAALTVRQGGDEWRRHLALR